MTKSWSSFEGQQLLHENWRNFLSEETSALAQRLRDSGYDTEDHWEEPDSTKERRMPPEGVLSTFTLPITFLLSHQTSVIR